MFFLFIFYVFFFFIIGYLLNKFQNQKQKKLENEFNNKLNNFNLFTTKKKKIIKKRPKLFLLKNESIFISSKISAALQEFFDIILARYINSWYQGFSNNEDFLVEIKFFFHTLCSEVLVRISQIDMNAIITDKILPVIVNHLEICCNNKELYNYDLDSFIPIEDVLLQQLKSHLHVIMISRTEELIYLRCIGSHIIPLVTPDYFSQTDNKTCLYFMRECLVGSVLLPLMDTFATPDIINNLICLLMEPSSNTTTVITDSSMVLVPILHKYQDAWINRLKTKKAYPKRVEYFLRNETNLYNFLQFIKRIETVPPISFFLLMDSITINLHNPELNTNDKINLLNDLILLNELINDVETYSDINISSYLHRRVLKVIDQGCESVTQLMNCEIWIENYNSICEYIETVYLTQYFESEFYLSSIYGPRELEYALDPSFVNEWEDIPESPVNIDSNYSPEKNESSPKYFPFKRMSFEIFNFDFTFDRKLPVVEDIRYEFSNTEKAVLSTFKKERKLIPMDEKDNSILQKSSRKCLISGDHFVETDSIDLTYDPDISDQDYFMDSFKELPDLSFMKVKVLSISQSCNTKLKVDFHFIVNTYKIDCEELLFKVYRKYREFYVLEQKLIEFHGEIGQSLSSKRSWNVKTTEFLDSCKNEFEIYLMFLVNEPFLKNSQLLFRFLTIQSDFNDNTLIDLNLGRFVKSVPMKLAKEKGQFLEQFMGHFHMSCDKIQSSKMNEPSTNLISENAPKSLIDNRIHMKMFWNNSGLINISSEDLQKQICLLSSRVIFSFYDILCYLYEIISSNMEPFQILLRCVYRLRPILSKLVESYVAYFLKGGIETICQERQAIEIINLLKDSVFLNKFSRTNSEKSVTREEARQLVRNLVPKWISVFLRRGGRDIVIKDIDRIFHCLQQPKLNKQLSYVILDIVLVELFPELIEHVSISVTNP